MSGIGELLYEFVTTTLNLNEELANILIIIVDILLWLVIGFLVIRFSKVVVRKILRVEKKGAKALTISNLIVSVTRYFIWFIVIMVILSNLGVDLTPFIASAGVIGLAIGFGAQEIVRDFMSGFFIIFDGEFEVGEVIEVSGFKGKVISIGLRTTVIENWKGERKIVNNGSIGSIVNFSRNNSVAIVDFGVAYDTDLKKINELMQKFTEEIEMNYAQLTEKPTFLGVVELASSSINLRLIAKTESMQHFQVERDIRRDVVSFLNENGIEIPFPQVVVHNAQV